MKTKPGEAARWLANYLNQLPDTSVCVDWPFGLSTDGYPTLSRDNRKVTVTRLVLSASVGPPPDGHFAAHAPGACHNPRCINPAHLRWASNAENQHDRFIDGTHNGGARNGMAVLTEDQVLAIYESTKRSRDLQAEYGVCRATILHIRSGRTWRSVTGAATSSRITS